jgi:phage tail-like protein
LAEPVPYYPPTAFYFEVSVLGLQQTAADGSFQEVSGLDRELEVQAVPEGGENRFAHQLPKRGRHPNLVLRRGIVPITSALADWAEATLGSNFTKPIQTRNVMVTLLGGMDKRIVWTFKNAYPVKWSTAGFKAMDNAIAVETLELAYGWVAREIRGKKWG